MKLTIVQVGTLLMKTMSTKKKATRAVAERPSVGDRILKGLTEVRDALASGQRIESRFTVRTFRLPDPSEYDAKAVRNTREKLHASQQLFAKLIGASPALVKAWEQGSRRPNPMARRLLDEVNREPKRWSSLIVPAEGGQV